jgi:signal transduction histidine kinase
MTENGFDRVRILELVQGHLVELSEGHCSITEESLDAEPDPTVREVLAGLYLLSQDLHYQRRKLTELGSELLHIRKLEAVGRLAAGIAHEINTPAQFVGDNLGFLAQSVPGLIDFARASRALVETLEAGAPTDHVFPQARAAMKAAKLGFILDNVPSAIEQAQEGLGRIARVVRAMKEFSHPSKGTKTATSLPRAIETTVEVARNEWKYVAHVQTSFEPELPDVPVLRDEFNQAILNLLVNAAHAIEDAQRSEPGTIAISVRRLDGCALIEIEDDGIGMPDGVMHRIFDPFFTTKEVGRGTGQGLGVVRSVIVDKHGGAVDVRSEPGKGTRFTLRIPLQPPEAEAA